MVTLNFRLEEVLAVKAHFGRTMPILFLTLTPTACARTRHALNMREAKVGLWLDNMSKDETMKRITILPERMNDESKIILTRLFGSCDFQVIINFLVFQSHFLTFISL